MRVCLVSPSYPAMQCGIGDYTFQLVEALGSLGPKITVITSRNKKVECAKGAGKISVLPVIRNWGIFGLPYLLKRIRRSNPEVVHIQYQWWMYHRKAMITFLPIFLKMLGSKTRIVTTFHDLMGPYLFPKAAPLRRACVKLLAAYSDRVIATNDEDYNKLARILPRTPQKIVKIPIGAGIFLNGNTQSAIGKYPALRDNPGQILISNFGYMLPYKGLEELLGAARILLDKKYDFKILAIGGTDIERKISDTYFDGIRRQAEELNIASHLRWIGHSSPEEAAGYLLASDICVLPYRDGVSERRSSFISVLSFGLPVVTTKGSNTPSNLINRDNVLLVEPGNPGELAAAIEELMQSVFLRKSLGRQARRLYEREYAWPVIAENIYGAYANN